MVKKILTVVTFLSLTVFHPYVFALAMAELQLISFLNQELNAVIELSAQADELDSLNITISRLETESAGLQRWPGLKAQLVREENGRSYIKITSENTVREPVINFLLDLSWSKGRIKREYSLLVDLN